MPELEEVLLELGDAISNSSQVHPRIGGIPNLEGAFCSFRQCTNKLKAHIPEPDDLLLSLTEMVPKREKCL